MIQAQSQLQVIDNSGAKRVKCIKVRGKSPKAGANLGDILVLSVQKASSKATKLKKSDIVWGVLVQRSKSHIRKDGTQITFGRNAVVLITKQKKAIGTRLTGVFPKDLRNKKWMKLASMAPAIL
uniref:Ribosomal protein L14 n=1 Tax=Schizocladia ischiensis TaxID=196139 RepID=A0A7S6ZPD6_9STRA|nr:ribosomal protein L14 [Schizocladia ischiensis]QOW07624.1 ribosomal protein L14 [Schizocladia ischiensis]